MTLLRSALLRSSLVLAGIVLALALAEGLVRAMDVGPTFQVVHREMFQLSSNPRLGYELRPLARDSDTTLNSAGFRDREFTLEKPPGVFRIVAIGDSVTFGRPKSRDETFSKHLERLLNACSLGPRFEVLNLGVIGYNAVQIAERLRVLGMKYAPDLVLYGYVLNDPQEHSNEGLSVADLRQAEELRFRAQLGRSALRWLSSSRLFLLVYHELEFVPQPNSKSFKRREDPGFRALTHGDVRGEYFRSLHRDPESLARLRRGLDSLDKTAGEIPVVMALFPLFLDPAAGPYPLADVHAKIAEEAEARGFESLEMEPFYRAAASRFPWGDSVADFLHPSEFGHRVAAIALFFGLLELGRVPVGSVDRERLFSLSETDVEIARVLQAR